jgi:hypothetical protein
MYTVLLSAEWVSMTYYARTVGLGSQQFAGYVNAPVTAPSTIQAPCAMPFHTRGVLWVPRSTPPQFHPGQVPPAYNMSVLAQAQFNRAMPPAMSRKSNAIAQTKYVTPMPSSMRTRFAQSRAVGRSKLGPVVSTKAYDPSYTSTMLQRARAGGCTAPKKKSAVANRFSSVGGWGSTVRSTY